MPSMHDDGGTVETGLEEFLVGAVANCVRHLAVGIGDHAVGRNDGVTFDAAQSNQPNLKAHERTQQRKHADDDDDHAHKLFGAPVDRQHVDEIENKDDH